MNRTRTKFCNEFAKDAGKNPWTNGTNVNPGGHH